MTNAYLDTLLQSIINEDSDNKALTLCVIHMLQEREFSAIMEALIEVNPKNWGIVREYVESVREK